MTLKETIEKLPKNKTIFLGAESCYLWIGNNDETIMQELEKSSCDRFEYVHKNLIPKTEKQLEKIENYKKTIDSEIALLEELRKENEEFTTSISTKKLNIQKAKVRNMQRIIASEEVCNNRLELYSQPFIPFLERQVREVYRVDSINKGIVVLIEGYEKGSYWSLDECMKGVR